MTLSALKRERLRRSPAGMPDSMPTIVPFTEELCRMQTEDQWASMGKAFAETRDRLAEIADQIWESADVGPKLKKDEAMANPMLAGYVYSGLLQEPERYGELRIDGAEVLKLFLCDALMPLLLREWGLSHIRLSMLFAQWASKTAPKDGE